MVEARFIQTHPNAKLPTQAHNEIGIGDSGFDLYAAFDSSVRGVYLDINDKPCMDIKGRESTVIPVGLKLAYITPGYWFRVEARSGLGFKSGIQPHFGIIDNPYRGDLGIKLYNLTSNDYTVTTGDRIAQIVFYPLIQPTLSFTNTVIESNRGAGGHGSTGR